MTENERLEPTSGFLEGDRHFLPMRVYYEDTDALGIVYHSNYLKFMERGRTEFLRHLGISNLELAHRSEGMTWAVASTKVDYLAAAKLDDAVVVISRAIRLGAASITIEQDIVRGEKPLAKGIIKVACMDKNGRPRRIPLDLKQKFESLREKPIAES